MRDIIMVTNAFMHVCINETREEDYCTEGERESRKSAAVQRDEPKEQERGRDDGDEVVCWSCVQLHDIMHVSHDLLHGMSRSSKTGRGRRKKRRWWVRRRRRKSREQEKVGREQPEVRGILQTPSRM